MLLARALARGIDLTAIVAGAAVLLMMVQVTLDVALRYLFNLQIPATIAIVSNYYMVTIVFLPLALPEKWNAHITVEVMTELLPDAVQQHLRHWIHLFSAIVFAILAYATWLEAVAKFRMTDFIVERGYAVPVWPAYFTLPVGAFLLMLLTGTRFVAYLFGVRDVADPMAAGDGEPREAAGK